MIKIITDSGCDISQEEAKRFNIKVIPIITIFSNKEFLDGVDITPDEFYSRLEEKKEFAKTTQVNPGMYQQAFEEEINQGNEVLCLTLGSKLSGCHQSAMLASNSIPSVKISILDTNSVCVGQRNLVYAALEDIQKGMNLSEITKDLEQKKKRLVVLASVDTLEYLVRGGRISKTAAMIGTLFSIKPVIELQDGLIRIIGKARGYKNAHNLLTKTIEKQGGIDFSLPYATAYSGREHDLLDKYLSEAQNLYMGKTTEVPVYRIGAAIGTHCGPGAVAVSFFRKEESNEGK
jgi:DegV family protein with EDD domain